MCSLGFTALSYDSVLAGNMFFEGWQWKATWHKAGICFLKVDNGWRPDRRLEICFLKVDNGWRLGRRLEICFLKVDNGWRLDRRLEICFWRLTMVGDLAESNCFCVFESIEFVKENWATCSNLWRAFEVGGERLYILLCKFRGRSKCWSWFEVVLSKRGIVSCIRGQLLE